MTPSILAGYHAVSNPDGTGRGAGIEPFDLRDARLGGRPVLAHVGRAMVDLSMERVTDGASSVTMTIRDPGMDLLRSGVLVRGVELTAWRRNWVLVGLDEASDRSITVAFESKRVNDLKKDRRKLQMKGTRPRFSRAALGSTPLVMPDETRVRSALPGAMGVGFGPSDRVLIAGKPATLEQRVVLDTMLAAAYEQSTSVGRLRALVCAVLAESRALNMLPDAATGSRGGPLRLPTWVGVQLAARDMRAVAKWFVLTGHGKPRAIAAARLRRPATRYAPFEDQAAKIVSKWLRQDAVLVAKTSALVKKHLTESLALSVGAPGGEVGESRWDALQRVWTDLGWYVIETDAGFSIVSGQHVAVAKPDLVLHPELPGVIAPSFSTDEGFVVNTSSWQVIEQRVGAVHAGMVVDVVGYGEGNGRYLITNEKRSEGSAIVGIDLETPQPVVNPQAGGTKDTVVSIEGVPAGVAAAYAKAQEIGAKRYPYVFGGGHGSFNGPYDCSGFVSALLNAGGALSSPMATGGLISHGVSGKGQFMTFWVRETGNARQSHTYASFTLPGKSPEKWESGGGGGVTGLRPGGQIERSGFQPRHIPGW